jgi:hypothetical protein
MSLEENIFMARVAEQAERFDDMVAYLQKVVESKGEEFTTEERNLLSVGFKNQIGTQRTALRTIGAIEQNPKYSKFDGALGVYKKKIEGELASQCETIIGIVKNSCLKDSAPADTKAFFQKMIGDYYRYESECNPSEEVKSGALKYYQDASTSCEGL